MKAISIKQNSKGKTYALHFDGKAYGVWVLCENYDGRVRGGIRKSWRYVQKDMPLADAEKLFNRRTK